MGMAVFPGLQGGPHNHQIGALAAQLLEVNTPEFKEYSKAVVSNSQALAKALQDNGSKLEKVCEEASISLNRNAVHGDASALSPGGVRFGSPAMAPRGCTADDFVKIAGFLDRCCQIALKIQTEKGKKLKDFEAGLKGNLEIESLKKDVQAFASAFGYPGL